MQAFRRSLANHAAWFFPKVLLPFFVTRFIWLGVALFATNFAPNPTYAEYATRGWFLSPHFWIDIWSHWDAKWYLSIVEQGYQAPADLTSTISNIAFFPLFPYLVKALSWLLPGGLVSRSTYLLIGLLVSNLSFLVAAGLFFRLVTAWFDRETAEKGLKLYFIFPTSFFFSAFYSESLFLLLAVGSFFLATQQKWVWSGLLAALLALTRPQGVLIVPALLLFYLGAKNWKLRDIRLDMVVLLAPAVSISAHLYYLYTLTGNLLAPLVVQKSWGRLADNYLERLWIEIGAPVLDVFKFDLSFLLIFLITSILLLRRKESRPFGVFSLLIILLPVLSGSVISVTRYVLIAFPVFAYWGNHIRNPYVFRTLRAVLWTLQILFFLGWANYYWVA